MRPELRISEDGSSTLYRADMNEHYHSFHGAIQESMHVFIEAGLRHLVSKSDLYVLEVGFGTGLNALLTMINNPGSIIKYHGIEKFPVPLDLAAEINFPEILGGQQVASWYNTMLKSEWQKAVQINDDFILTKFEIDLCDFSSNTLYDLVYFDAFAPDKQPELWTDSVFDNIFNMMAPGAILTTYSAKGSVRRSMQRAGFIVERIPGPPGKREMIRAVKE